MKPHLQIVQSISRLVCTGCGAETNAACNCGKAYEVVAEKLADIREQARQRDRAYKERKRQEKQQSSDVADDAAERAEARCQAQWKEFTANEDSEHEEGLRVLAARGFLHRAIDATRLADLGRLGPADVTDELIEKAECAAAAWNTAARQLRGLKCQGI